MSRLALAVLCAGVLFAAPPSWAKPGPNPTPSASASTGGLQSSPPNAVLNREEFEEALRGALRAMHGCYESALKKDAIAEGAVVLIVQTRGGKVLKAETDVGASTLNIQDATARKEMHKCITNAAKTMKMPLAKVDGKHDPKATAVVRYPVEFSLGVDVVSGVQKTTGAKIDPDAVKRAFEVHKFTIGRCYLEAKKSLRSPVGKLVLKIAVTGGKVTGVDEDPDTTVEDKIFKTCVADVVKGLPMPSAKDSHGKDDPTASSVIYYPLQFR